MSAATKTDPPCLGTMWDATPGGEEACNICMVKNRCLEGFAEFLREQRQPDEDLTSLAGRLGARLPSVQAGWRAGDPRVEEDEAPAPVREPVVKSEEPEPEPEVVEAATVEIPTIEEKEPEVPKKKAAKKKAKKKAAKKKAPAKKKAAKKKAPPKKKVSGVVNPPVAGPVQSASGPAATTQETSAVLVSARGSKGWGADKTRERWVRERRRNPMIAALVPGSILTRQWKGQEYQIEVLKTGYRRLDNRTKYPTLQAVTDSIAGLKAYPAQRKKAGAESTRREGTRLMSNWSAARFWRTALEQAFNPD